MDDDLDRARRLFADVTALLEDAIEIAIAGQSPTATGPDLVEVGQRLEAATNEILAVARAARAAATRAVRTPK
tara:strand:- start:3441 stop:3659 length:219 start_codon:yes stop_codon:yes gene_type:complete